MNDLIDDKTQKCIQIIIRKSKIQLIIYNMYFNFRGRKCFYYESVTAICYVGTYNICKTKLVIYIEKAFKKVK